MALTGDYADVLVIHGKCSKLQLSKIIGNAVLRAMDEYPGLPVVVRLQEEEEENHEHQR